MNKSYRLIWSRMKEVWVVVSEKVAAKGARPAVTVGCFAAALLLAASGPALALDPGALPTGGRITAGGGAIEQSGATLTVNQQTGKLVAHWDTFDIGRDAAVRFNQPGSSSVALNRIFDQNPSQIFGNLSANGQVFLLNPAGIVFGPNARVDVGTLVASSLDLADDEFLAGNYHFAGDSGGIINQGDITAAEGGVVALIAPRVTNEGTITTPGGSTLLAAGSQVSLDFTGDGLLSYTVEQGAVDVLAENKGLIKADGGLVVMTARAADLLTSAVVNNEGVVEAQTLETRAGRILLLSDMDHGETIVGGRLDASAPNGGDGGFIETSAATVQVRDGVQITTAAPDGKTGTWLIDPVDITIAAADGNVTGSTIATALQTTDVTLDTSDAGSCTGVACSEFSSTAGDIFIDDNIVVTDGSADTTLTLKANNNIIMEAGKNITRSGDYKLNTVFWADSDANGGGVLLKNGASINTNGGHLWMGGGNGSVVWNGLTVGDGYAVGNDFGLADAQRYSGIAIGENVDSTTPSNISIQTNGGNTAMYGNSSVNINAHTRGIGIANGTTINSGTGTILLDGKTTNTNPTAGWRNAIEIINGTGSTTTITSANTSSDAIIMRGDASTANTLNTDGVTGVQINGANTVISATAGGGIDISGKANTGFAGSNNYDLYLTNASILANSGRIKLTGQTSIGTTLNAGVVIGQKSGSAVTASTSDIEIIADKLTFSGLASYLQSSGTLTIKPYTAGTTIGVGTGAGTLSLPTNRFSTNFVDGFSNITIGSADAGDITLGTSATSISFKDPLTLKTAGNITSAGTFSLTGVAGQTAHLTLWADADANSNGYIFIYDGSVINTNGGDIVMAGGLDNGANGGTAGDGIPDGYTFSTVSTSSGISIGRNNATANAYTSIKSDGGNILMRGKSTGASPSMGIHFANRGELRAGTGTLTMLGEASNYHGIELSAWTGGLLDLSVGTIDISGITSSSAHHGLAAS